MYGSSHLPSRHLRGRGRRLLGLRSTWAVRQDPVSQTKTKQENTGCWNCHLAGPRGSGTCVGPFQAATLAFSSVSLCRPGLCCPSLVCLCSSFLNVPLILSASSLSLAPAPRGSPPPSKPSSSSVHKTNKPKIVPVRRSALESLLFSHFGHESAAHTHRHAPSGLRTDTLSALPTAAQPPCWSPTPLSLASAEHHVLL